MGTLPDAPSLGPPDLLIGMIDSPRINSDRQRDKNDDGSVQNASRQDLAAFLLIANTIISRVSLETSRDGGRLKGF